MSLTYHVIHELLWYLSTEMSYVHLPNSFLRPVELCYGTHCWWFFCTAAPTVAALLQHKQSTLTLTYTYEDWARRQPQQQWQRQQQRQWQQQRQRQQQQQQQRQQRRQQRHHKVIIIFSITPRLVDWAMMRKKKTMLKKETVKGKSQFDCYCFGFLWYIMILYRSFFGTGWLPGVTMKQKKSIAKASGKPNLPFDVLCRAEIFLQLFQRWPDQIKEWVCQRERERGRKMFQHHLPLNRRRDAEGTNAPDTCKIQEYLFVRQENKMPTLSLCRSSFFVPMRTMTRQTWHSACAGKKRSMLFCADICAVLCLP